METLEILMDGKKTKIGIHDSKDDLASIGNKKKLGYTPCFVIDEQGLLVSQVDFPTSFLDKDLKSKVIIYGTTYQNI
jgi:hypothetical protein